MMSGSKQDCSHTARHTGHLASGGADLTPWKMQTEAAPHAQALQNRCPQLSAQGLNKVSCTHYQWKNHHKWTLKSAHIYSSKLKRGKRYPAGTTCKVSTANFPTNKDYPFSSMIFMSQRKRKLKNISPSKSDKLGCTHTSEFQKWSLSVVAVLHSDHRKNS